MAKASTAQVALENELIQEIAKFQHDPLGYVRFAYPWGEAGTELEHDTGPREWQSSFLREIGDLLKAGIAAGLTEALQMASSSGHGIGKSAVVAWLCDWAVSTREDTRGVVTANTEGQLMTKTWPELAKWRRLAINKHWFTMTATALYAADPAHEKTWRIDAISWSEHNTEAFAGLHNKGKRILVVFDEASKIADRVWDVTEGALTDANTEIVWAVFGNPTRATGRFRECFRRFRHRWHTRNIDSRTVDGTNKVQIQKWIDDYGEESDFVKVRVRGIFPALSAKQYISETDVLAAYGKHLREDQYSWAPKILTVDPAWEGDDELVIGFRQGLMFRILATIPKNDNDVQIANLIARHEDELQADAVFIDGGYGTGIVSVGRTLGRAWVLVWFQEGSYDLGCLNKRAEMWQSTRNWLKEGGAIPADPILRDDLTSPETVARLDGKLQLEAKKDMKARGLPSPGRGDALALSFAHPVVAKSAMTGKSGQALHEYDPFRTEAYA